MTRTALIVACALACVLLDGCFATTGLLIGSATDRTRPLPPGELPAGEQCVEIRVKLATPDGHTRTLDGLLVDADSAGFRASLEGGPVVTTSWHDVQQVSCRDGSYAIAGLAIGALFDVLVTVAVAASFHGISTQ